MAESPALPDDQDTARCPIPEWALRPLAILLPILGIACIIWLIFR